METIVYFKVENGKRIVFAEGVPAERGMSVLSGANGSGKSSLLTFIKSIIGGKKYLPEEPVHDGARKAHAVIETQSYKASLTVPKSGNPKWTLKTKSGEPFKGTCLSVFKELTGTDMFFNISELMVLKGKQQVDYIKKLFNIDMSDADATYQRVYDKRTEVNRKAKEAEGAASQIKFAPDLPKEEVSTSALLSEYNGKQEHNQKVREDYSLLTKLKESQFEIEQKIQTLLKEIEKSNAQLKTVASDKEALEEKLKTSTIYVLSSLQDEINNVEVTNAAIREQAKRKDYISAQKSFERESEALSEELKTILDEKKRMLETSNLPEGLGFQEDCLVYKGLPFTERQMSSAEAMLILVKIAFKAIPADGLRVVIIENGGLFDQDSLRKLDQIAKAENGQILIEKPDINPENCEFYFEAGELK